MTYPITPMTANVAGGYPADDQQPDLAPAPAPQPKMIDPSEVITRWRKAQPYLERHRNNYQLNQSFFQGEQWVRIAGRQLQDIQWSHNDEWQSRTTVDKFGPRTRSLIARFIAEDLEFEAQADGNDDVSMRKKSTREQILSGIHDQDAWEDTREDEVLDALFGGTSAVAVEWDPNAEGYGEEPIVDPDTGFEYQSGGLYLCNLSICDFCLWPNTADWRSALAWIKGTSAPPEVVQQRYNLSELPQADVTAVMGARQRTLVNDWFSGENQAPRNTAVYVYYCKPTGTDPGYEMHVVNGKVVEASPWRFPFKRLNLYVFRAQRQRGYWPGVTLLSTARPVQASFNHIRTTIMEHARKAANARLMVPEGSVPDEDVWTDNVADIVRYTPDPSGAQPNWMNAPQVPRWLSAEADRLEADMDDIFHTHDVTRGQAPGDRNSGLALSILAEKDDTPLSSIARDQARGWGEIAEMVLMLMRKEKPNGGQITLVQNGIPRKVQWTGDDIGDNPKVIVPLKQTMPRTKTATQALITNMLQAIGPLSGTPLGAAIDTVALARLVGVTTPEQFLRSLDNDDALAQWENEMMADGVTMVPDLFNDQSKHIVCHEAQQNTPQYAQYPPQVQQLFQQHIDAHKALEQEKAQQQVAAGGAPSPAAGGPPGGPASPGGPPANGPSPDMMGGGMPQLPPGADMGMMGAPPQDQIGNPTGLPPGPIPAG